MGVTRKELLAGGAALAVAGCGKPSGAPAAPRSTFALAAGWRHFDAFLFAAHPKPVRDAIERHRRGLDRGAADYLRRHERALDEAVAVAGGRYLGVQPSTLAFVDSTTMGLALTYRGLPATGRRGAHDRARPLRHARIAAAERSNGSQGASVRRPRGYHSFEHRWALAQAFDWQRRLGRAKVADRTHGLATRLKDGLARMRHVSLVTPRSPEISSGIVCFDVAGLSPGHVVSRLAQRRIRASVTPYAETHVRLGTSLHVDAADVDGALAAVKALQG